jgi:hypothetical protein
VSDDAPPEFLSIPDAAIVLGVSRQRVHDWLAEREATVPVRDVSLPNRKKRLRQLATAAVLAWREERIASGQPVGPMPPSWSPPPAVPEVPPMPIGLMIWRPF